MAEISPVKKSGCGLLGAVFRRRSPVRPIRSTSADDLRPKAYPDNMTRHSSTPTSKRRKDGLDRPSFLGPPPDANDRIIARPGQNHSRPSFMYQQQHAPKSYAQNHAKKGPQNGTRRASGQQGYIVPHGALGISGELETMITDHQKTKGASSLIRASSGNVMLYGNLGNLRQPGNKQSTNSTTVLDYLPKTAKEEQFPVNGKYNTSVMGNVVKKNEMTEKPISLSRALSTRMDPEELKILGNEDYKNGRFAEALALYDAAIAIDPNKASYRSNKSAALTALGKLLEAAFECREAIRVDPYYLRAHNRLATLYVRLGEAEKAVYHFKQAAGEADPDAMNKAKKVQAHLNKCIEAKRQHDWNTLLEETDRAIAAGADSAPLILALKAEAFLKLQSYQEAIDTVAQGPDFDTDDCTKFFGPIGNASLLVLRAQVNMAAGRFDDAVAAAQLASTLDVSNKEVKMVLRRAKAVATARSNGNELFKGSRYSEACIAYGEGLNHDPYNPVLLGNRAACRSKLGQYEKAIEDCNIALRVRPSYSKARLRRADCYAKLGKWEACIQDCEVLIKESRDAEEIENMLNQAREQVQTKQGSQHMRTMNNFDVHPNVIVVSSNERFRDYVTSSGLSVVLFCNKSGEMKNMQFMEQLYQKNPSVKFLKVEIEDHPSLAKSEGINSLPAFIIYKNGSRTKEIPGDNHKLLESKIKFYITS